MKKATKDKMVKESKNKGNSTVLTPFSMKGVAYQKDDKLELSKFDKERLSKTGLVK